MKKVARVGILVLGLSPINFSWAELLHEFDAGSAGNTDNRWSDTQGLVDFVTGEDEDGSAAIHFARDSRTGFSKEYHASTANLHAGAASGLPNRTYTLEIWIHLGAQTATGEVIFETGGQSNGLGLFTTSDGLLLATSSTNGAEAVARISLSGFDKQHYIQVVAVFDTAANRLVLRAKDVNGMESIGEAVSDKPLNIGPNGMSLFGGGNGSFTSVAGDTGGYGASGTNLPKSPKVFSGGISLFRIYTGLEPGIVLASYARNVIQPVRNADPRPNFIVIFTDDHGYADMGINGQDPDVLTPNIDDLARTGVRFTSGYVTAPQCVPSRAGLLSGKYQQRFGVVANGKGPMAQSIVTIPERLRNTGYRTGMIGKWHLEPNQTDIDWAAANNLDPKNIPVSRKRPYYPDQQGFDEYAFGNANIYWSNFNRDGKDGKPLGMETNETGHRLDIQSDYSAAFIDRNHTRPFFLYVSYFAPHAPLEQVSRYGNTFKASLPAKRKTALGMIKAMDDGVGRIRQKLVDYGIDNQTIIWFIGDNGAPLGFQEAGNVGATDASANWNGSLNTPFRGEKGMLSEGGTRVPWIMWWAGKLSPQIYTHPVISLDVAATINAMAGLPFTDELDGVNIIPFLTGENAQTPHDYLYWQFWNQRAVRSGKWKYLTLANNTREYLFDLENDQIERVNLAGQYPEIVVNLRNKLGQWDSEVGAGKYVLNELNSQESAWFKHYFGLGIDNYDSDNDGSGNLADLFPDNPAESRDADGDGIGDNADADDDNDLLPDEFEIEFGLNPFSSDDANTDPDGDGLSNYQEYLAGTNPRVPDTDMDGVGDGEELQNQRNPLVNESSVIMLIQTYEDD